MERSIQMNELNIVKMLVPENKWGKKCPYSMEPTRIVVHNTYNDASATSEISYMISNDFSTSFHYAIDDKKIVQGIPENRNAWHAGDGKGKGNREGLSIEICYSKSGGERFIEAEKNTAKFIAYKLKEKGWGIDRVTKHQDYSGKYCPHRTLDMGWQRFLNLVQSYLDNVEYKEEKAEYLVGTSPVDNEHCKGIFVDKEKALEIAKMYNLNVYKGKDLVYVSNIIKKAKIKQEATNYYTGQVMKDWVKGEEFTVKIMDEKNERALLSEINSWVYLKDLEIKEV